MGNNKVVVLFLFDGPENTRLNKYKRLKKKKKKKHFI